MDGSRHSTLNPQGAPIGVPAGQDLRAGAGAMHLAFEPNPAATNPPLEAEQALPLIPSHQLLQGRNWVRILHNGAIYRLQMTRQGKLILTK